MVIFDPLSLWGLNRLSFASADRANWFGYLMISMTTMFLSAAKACCNAVELALSPVPEICFKTPPIFADISDSKTYGQIWAYFVEEVAV